MLFAFCDAGVFDFFRREKPRNASDNETDPSPGFPPKQDPFNGGHTLVREHGTLIEQEAPQRAIPYRIMFPTPFQLFPGEAAHAGSSKASAQELNILKQQGLQLQEDTNLVQHHLDEVSNGNKSAVHELVSVLTTLVNAASQQQKTRKTAFVGLQGVGKSFVQNLMTLLGLGVSSAGLGTKAVVHYELRRRHVEDFHFNGKRITFEDISTLLVDRFSKLQDVEDVTIKIAIHAPWVPFQVDYLDVPGMPTTTRTAQRKDTVMQIIRNLASYPDIDFVVVADAFGDPDAAPDDILVQLAQASVPVERIIPVLNKVNVLLSANWAPAQIKIRIDAWTAWFKQPPYLFAAEKQVEFDEVLTLPPQQQVTRWMQAVKNGDERVKEFAALHLPDHPKAKLGVSKAVEHIARNVISDITSIVDGYISELNNETRVADTDHQMLNQFIIHQAFMTFTTEFPRHLQDIAFRRGGIALETRFAGGQEFFETEELTDARNEECLRVFKYAGPSTPGRWVRRQVKTLKVITGASAVQFGVSIMTHDFSRHQHEILARFTEFSDEELRDIMPLGERTHTTNFVEAIPIAISQVGKSVRIQEFLENAIGRQACNLRRVVRAALWLYQRRHPEHTPMGFLLRNQHFRKAFQRVVDENIEKLVTSSQNFMRVVFGEVIDAPPRDTAPLLHTSMLESTYPDLQRGGTHLQTPPIPEQESHPQVERMNRDWNEVFQYMRKAIKAHYSSCMIHATHSFEYHFSSAWLRLLHGKLTAQWMAPFTELGRHDIVQTLKLQEAVQQSSLLERAMQDHHAARFKAMNTLVNVRDKFVAALGEFNPLQDYLFGSQATADPESERPRDPE